MAIPSARLIFTSYIKCVLVAGKKLNLCLPGSFMTGGKSCSTLFFMALFLPLHVSLCVCGVCTFIVKHAEIILSRPDYCTGRKRTKRETAKRVARQLYFIVFPFVSPLCILYLGLVS